MISPQLLHTLLLVSCVLCSHAWDKTADLQDAKERGLEGVQSEDNEVRLESLQLQKGENPCAQKGKALSIDVRRVSEKFK